MRIVLVAPFALHPKGTTRWRVLPLARALAAQGHAMRVVIPPYDWPAHSGLRWQDGSVEVMNVPVSGRQLVSGHALLAARLVQASLDWQPDVVHCFKPKGHSGLAALALLAQRRVPVLVDTDDYEAGWNCVLGYPRHWQAVFAWQERNLLRRASGVTVASRWLAGFAASLGQQNVHYLPNGVAGSHSQNTMAGSRLPFAADQPARLCVLLYTRFVEHSPQEVWRVWQRVLADSPDAQLFVAGRGRAGEEAVLAEIASNAGAGRSIQTLGWLPANTRPGLFAAVDAAMLPVQDTPLNRAKSPMRLLDLLAAGVPVATQRVGEYGTIVADGVTGLLADPADAAGLAQHVVTLLREPGLGRQLGAAAAAAMQTGFAWPRLAQRALAAYRATLAVTR
jgi:glycosyltransferase involved in cell wall biosynthesis